MINVELLWQKGSLGRGRGIDFDCIHNIFASADSNDINIWRLSDDMLLKRLQGNGYVNDLMFSPDGSKLISSHYFKTFIWNTSTFQRSHEIDISSAYIAYHPKNKYFATTGGRYEYDLYLWMPESGEQIRTFYGHEALVDCIVFNHNGTILASGDRDGWVRLWLPDTGEIIFEIKYGSSISNLAFHTENNLLAVGTDKGIIQVISADNGATRIMFPYHDEHVISIHWLQNSNQIISASTDGMILTWDATTGELQKRVQSTKGRISFFKLDCEQRYLALVNKTLRVFSVKLDAISTSTNVSLHPEQHPNITTLMTRMEDALKREDYAGVLHACASIFETLAKDVVGIPTVENQTLKSFFERYRKDSQLSPNVLDYILDVYNARNKTPLAGHGSLTKPTISQRDATLLSHLTKAFVNSEYELRSASRAK